MSATVSPEGMSGTKRAQPRRLVEELVAKIVPAFGLLVEEGFRLGATAGDDTLDARGQPELDRASPELGADRPFEERIVGLDAVIRRRPLACAPRRDRRPGAPPDAATRPVAPPASLPKAPPPTTLPRAARKADRAASRPRARETGEIQSGEGPCIYASRCMKAYNAEPRRQGPRRQRGDQPPKRQKRQEPPRFLGLDDSLAILALCAWRFPSPWTEPGAEPVFLGAALVARRRLRNALLVVLFRGCRREQDEAFLEPAAADQGSGVAVVLDEVQAERKGFQRGEPEQEGAARLAGLDLDAPFAPRAGRRARRGFARPSTGSTARRRDRG